MMLIDSVDLVFRPLFSIRFIHSGFQTPKENFFADAIAIVPDDRTKKIFANYKMNYLFYTNTLTCFMQCSMFNPPTPEPKIPSIKIDGDIMLRFLLKSKDDFFGRTYVTAAGGKNVYQFTNKVNNTSGGNVFLSAPVETHVAAKDYNTGTVVQDGGNLYASLVSVKAADNIAISDGSHWKQLQAVEQVVNNADLQDATAVNAGDKCFGVIDMYNNGTSNNIYNLFDVSEKLFDPAPVFSIKFESKF
ncbi:hypothetical protein [Pinibacter soli]|uniref:Uncharacterized protein n=1 Tax=Pinibacter soli TaxID=3044211 RepID=A0ABT6RB43_9BACT|nr:hypothetical protein [Pinibacter soli]MDI3319788.1 hypothetical protein [Pinibacter soli]